MLQKLIDQIEQGAARVGVIGLGYVGLPLVRELTAASFRVIGFDIDPEHVSQLNSGKSYIRHIGDDLIRRITSQGAFTATDAFDRLSEPDVIIICVPTPLTPAREPDLRFVRSSVENVARTLRRGQLVVLESTTYPGTTREVVLPILESSSLRTPEDFLLAYSPEREDPGNAEFTTSRIPKVVGGMNPESARAACALYRKVCVDVVPVSDARTAEATKILENIYRAVNIALVNELKVLFDRMGIDVWEVIGAASTKPFGYQPFYPGPGLGGHCIPIDPFYLAWKAREFDVPTRFIELAGEVNAAMPSYVVSKATDALNDAGLPVKGSNILIMGVAYKKNVDDTRESPALEIIRQLQSKGARVQYHDPFVPRMPTHRAYPGPASSSVALSDEVLENSDCVIIVTDHDDVDYGRVIDKTALVVDTRNATAGLTGRAGIVKA